MCLRVLVLFVLASCVAGDPYFRIQAKNGKCVTIDQGGTNGGNGVKLVIWDCVGVEHQKWWLNYDNQGTTSNLYAHLKDSLAKCLTAQGGALNGGEVVQWDCVDVPHQIWVHKARDAEYGEIRTSTNRCLTIHNALGANGTPLEHWDCVGVEHQQWKFLD